MTAHNRIAPITHRPIAQGLRCASIAHPRLEIDLVDLKPPAVTACLHNDVDEHAKESANIVAGEIAAAFRFLDEQRQLFERAGGRTGVDGRDRSVMPGTDVPQIAEGGARSEEHTSEPPPPLRTPYA